MTAVVTVDIVGEVGYITLNRPEAMNAVTIQLGQELERAILDTADAVSVMVIRGAGGNFSVGGDFHELERLQALGVGAMNDLFESFGRACAAIASVDVPVVSAVEGYAMAGGFELMQASDIVLVSETAKIADTHLNHAQIPGGGSSQRLPRLVGRQRALAHILTGDRLSGREAEEWGLAYRAYPAEGFADAVAAFAEKLAMKDRKTLATAKRLIYATLELPLADGLLAERAAVLAHLSGDSATSGIQQFTKGPTRS